MKAKEAENELRARLPKVGRVLVRLGVERDLMGSVFETQVSDFRSTLGNGARSEERIWKAVTVIE